MIVTEEFQSAITEWLTKTNHRRADLARLAECDAATITRIYQQTGKRLDDAIANRICRLIGYDVPAIDSLYKMMLDAYDWPIGCFSEGRVLYANPALAELFGKVPDELVGHDITDFVDAENRSEMLHRITDRDPSPYEVTLSTPEGPKRLHVVPHMLTTHIRFVHAHPVPLDSD